MSPTTSRRSRQVNLDFHATREEVLLLAEEIAIALSATAVARFAFPFSVQRTSIHDLIKEPSASGRLMAVDLHRKESNLSVETQREYLESNKDLFSLEPGAVGDDFLRVAGMGGTSDNDELLMSWSKVTSAARRKMHRGATPVSGLGVSGKHFSHSYTDGALDLSRRGVRMLALVGDVQYRFDLLEPEKA